MSEGMGAGQMAQQLKEKGAIRTTLPFKGWVMLRGAGTRLRVGRYRFTDGRSAYWIVDDLVKGRTLKIKTIIPEGFASWQIAERLEVDQICAAQPFIALVKTKELEGFLFPATYEFDVGMSPEQVASLMTARFEQSWTPEMEQRTQELKLTKKQVVTLASIIEREARVRDELTLISAVYSNRLKKRMRLEADPTVQYAQGFWKGRLTYHDYRNTKSPYNTYLVGGLPPGPICSPGEDAIRAALWPAVSDALFFVAMEDGRHDFSTNYRDHTNKVNKRNRKNATRNR